METCIKGTHYKRLAKVLLTRTHNTNKKVFIFSYGSHKKAFYLLQGKNLYSPVPILKFQHQREHTITTVLTLNFSSQMLHQQTEQLLPGKENKNFMPCHEKKSRDIAEQQTEA